MRHEWKILILSDVGADADSPVRLSASEPDAWLSKLSPHVDAGLNGKAASLTFTDARAFKPENLASEATQLDAILHDPGVQRLESAWRGISFLLKHCGESVTVDLLPTNRKSVADDFRSKVFEPAMEANDPPTLIVADFSFSHAATDLATLRELAGMAKVIQAPIVAGASAGFFDLRFLVQAASLPDFATKLTDSAHTAWREFQASEEARWVTLTMNRWLQREPYDGPDYREGVSESTPNSYLWGNTAWLVAAAVARSVNEHGHALAIAGSQGGRFPDLPTRSWMAKANEGVAMTTEAPLSEAQVMELVVAGFTPLAPVIRSNAALMPSVVTTFRLRPGKLTLEGTLAYQLTAAHLAQACDRLLSTLPAGGVEEVAAHIRAELLDSVGSLAGGRGDEAVSVDLKEQSDGGTTTLVAEVAVKLGVKLEGKPLEFGFVLPVR